MGFEEEHNKSNKISTRQTSTLTISTKDFICSHKYTLLAQDITTSSRFYCITRRRPNNIL